MRYHKTIYWSNGAVGHQTDVCGMWGSMTQDGRVCWWYDLESRS